MSLLAVRPGEAPVHPDHLAAHQKLINDVQNMDPNSFMGRKISLAAGSNFLERIRNAWKEAKPEIMARSQMISVEDWLQITGAASMKEAPPFNINTFNIVRLNQVGNLIAKKTDASLLEFWESIRAWLQMTQFDFVPPHFESGAELRDWLRQERDSLNVLFFENMIPRTDVKQFLESLPPDLTISAKSVRLKEWLTQNRNLQLIFDSFTVPREILMFDIFAECPLILTQLLSHAAADGQADAVIEIRRHCLQRGWTLDTGAAFVMAYLNGYTGLAKYFEPVTAEDIKCVLRLMNEEWTWGIPFEMAKKGFCYLVSKKTATLDTLALALGLVMNSLDAETFIRLCASQKVETLKGDQLGRLLDGMFAEYEQHFPREPEKETPECVLESVRLFLQLPNAPQIPIATLQKIRDGLAENQDLNETFALLNAKIDERTAALAAAG